MYFIVFFFFTPQLAPVYELFSYSDSLPLSATLVPYMEYVSHFDLKM